MINYSYPENINGKCWMRIFSFECKVCGCNFILDLPYDYDLVKLIEKNGTEVRWLPVYGVGGYLDLVEKLAGVSYLGDLSGAKSMEMDRIMERELCKYTEKGEYGNGFIIGGYKAICPNCNSKELKVIDERVIDNPKIEWVKISDDLIK